MRAKNVFPNFVFENLKDILGFKGGNTALEKICSHRIGIKLSQSC